MKKIALTLVALAFGSCVGFAQSAPQKDTEDSFHTLTIDRMSNQIAEDDEDGRTQISIYELPETVQEQLKYSELAGHTIVSVTEVQPLAEGAPMQYELVLLEETENTKAEPALVVLFDEFGELLSQKEESTLAGIATGSPAAGSPAPQTQEK